MRIIKSFIKLEWEPATWNWLVKVKKGENYIKKVNMKVGQY